MTKSEDLLGLLMDRPEAYQILEKARQQLSDEQKRREEFYEWLRDDIKAEFINGEIVVHSPVRSRHAQASDNVFLLLSLYVRKHDLGRVTHEKVMSRFTRNDYEPDIMYFSKEKAETIQPKQALFPVPDFIIEILSESTEERDRGVKLNDFEVHGVQEYWLIDPETACLEQYILKNGHYELAKKTDEGIIHCSVVKGFDVPIVAIFDEKENFNFLQKITNSLI